MVHRPSRSPALAPLQLSRGLFHPDFLHCLGEDVCYKICSKWCWCARIADSSSSSHLHQALFQAHENFKQGLHPEVEVKEVAWLDLRGRVQARLR